VSVRVRPGTPILEVLMAKSSIDYAEKHGLMIALSNLEIVDITYQDEEWLTVVNWIKDRIKTLNNK
jgi:hypothetical protein